MQDQRGENLRHFVETMSNALFLEVQKEMGVQDGGAASLFWTGHDLIGETAAAIRQHAPDFEIGPDEAFSRPWPTLDPIPDLEPSTLLDHSRQYVARLGEIVGAELPESLAARHAEMLRDYIVYERHFTPEATAAGPRA